MTKTLKDIHPRTPISALTCDYSDEQLEKTFDDHLVAALCGMQPIFVRKVLGVRRGPISLKDVLRLLEQDAFRETFVPRSKIPEYLLTRNEQQQVEKLDVSERHHLLQGSAKTLIHRLVESSVRCVVTSTPYWGTRLYKEPFKVKWADGEVCPLGHEQTPEGFIRHTIEILYLLKRVLASDGSVWWNLMDTYNTRTQIRMNAAETLRAMNGQDPRSWKDYECRRYSAGHSYLKDGEQCMIPSRVAARASRIGYWVKSTISWSKEGSMPETVNTRVTREVEYIIHLTLQRSPYFDKPAYRRLERNLGGRNPDFEADKITDIWCLPTSSGSDGHGAQFPLALPARCIALSTEEKDLVLDPFVGAGTTSLAAEKLNRRSIGFDVSHTYLEVAQQRLKAELPPLWHKQLVFDLM